MGHLNKKYMLCLHQLSEGIEFSEALRKHKFDCVDYIKAQQHKQISKYPVKRPADKLEIVYADNCGPMQTQDFWGHTYFMTIVYAKTRFKWTYLMLKKNDFPGIFVKWKSWVECQFNTKIKQLHTDGGGEFMDTNFQLFLSNQGMEHVVIPPYSPNMNGNAEIWNKVIVQTVSAMLHTTNLDIVFWGQASLAATYLINRSPTKGLALQKTPYEALYRVKPYLGHIRIWGCRAYAHIPKESQKRKKWDLHTRECLLMGFYDSENMFKLYNIAANGIIKCRDVIFFEEVLGHSKFQRIPLQKSHDILGEVFVPQTSESMTESVSLDDEHSCALSL